MVELTARIRLSLIYAIVLVVVLGTEVLGVSSPRFLVDQLVRRLAESLPSYGQSQRSDIALKLAQVAVLYFAVLVAVVRFVHDSQKLAYESDRLLFVLPPFSLLLASVSAALAILTLLRVSPNESLIASLVTMGAAFFMSFLATVAGGVGRVQETDLANDSPPNPATDRRRRRPLPPVRGVVGERDDGPHETEHPKDP